MKRWMLLLLLTGCAAHRITHFRGGWTSCHAADPNMIRCGGKEVAQVECFHPAEEACGALAIRYADGERVFLFRPIGFEPGEEAEASLLPRAVLRPELASDGSMIWYKAAHARGDSWTIYESQTGISREVDAFQIFKIRERDPHSMPLWVATVPK
jgi:hypothetical protein